jgi:hypothetical protein
MLLNNIHKSLSVVFAFLLMSFTSLSYSDEAINPQVLIEGVTAEQVKAKIIERALARNLSLDNESQSKITVSYEFSGRGDGYRQLTLGVDIVREEIVYLLAPVAEGVKVYGRLYISGVTRRGETVRKQMAADDVEYFQGPIIGIRLQKELNNLKASFTK